MSVVPDTRRDSRFVTLVDEGTLRGAHIAPSAPVWPRVADRVQGTLVGAVAAIGALSALWFAVSNIFHLSLVIILTGSMAPGMPAGTLTVVQDVRANVVEVGDVITVPRRSSVIPVTHRVVEVTEDASDAQVRTFVLQGDANPRPDTETYTVRAAQRVVFAIPGVGAVFSAFGSPLAVGAGSILVAIIVMWVLWPRARPLE